MCYSALVEQGLKKYGVRFKSRVDYSIIEEYYRRQRPFHFNKEFEFNFRNPESPAEKVIHELIAQSTQMTLVEEQQKLFGYKKRLTDAERKLIEKHTKTAEKEKGVCERQIERIKHRIERIQSDTLSEEDGRIYAKDYAPVMVLDEKGERVIRPFRYLLRPDGQPESFDAKFSGCYNARRDNLEGFPWKFVFGKKHGILIVRKFFENVEEHVYQKRKLAKGEEPRNRVLRFEPQGHDFMVVPCLWDEWHDEKGEVALRSFALITDEPPPEVAETGHQRCPIFLKESAIDAWLKPQGKSFQELYAILDGERERPYYRHALVA